MEWRPYPFLTFNKTAAWGWYILVCLCLYRPSRQEGLEDLWWLREDQWSPDDQAFSHRTRHEISDVSRSYAGSLPLQRLMNVYKSSILPLPTYCHAAWHFCKAGLRYQKDRASSRKSTKGYLQDQKWRLRNTLKRARLPSLKNRRLQDIAIYMYKVKNNSHREAWKKFSQRNNPATLWETATLSHPDQFNTISYGKHSLRYLGPVVWSKLTSSVRQSPTLKNFKTKLREYDINSLLENNCNSCELCRS